MKIIEETNPLYKILPKFTTRARRKDDDESIINVDKIPDECDYVYEQYGEKYGISSRMILEYLQQGKIPIVVVNDADVIKKLQNKFGMGVKSYFIHREKPSREKLIQIYNKTRGTADPDIIEKRYETAMKIYSMYTDNIGLFDNIILNTGKGFEDVKKIVHQIVFDTSNKKRLTGLQGNKIFVIAGSPGSGKDILIRGANRLGCLQIPKYTDRERNFDDGTEMIFKEDPRYNLQNCKVQYESYGTNYGIDILPIWQNLIMTDKNQILVCSKMDALQQLKRIFGEAIVPIYVHSDMNAEEYGKMQLQNGIPTDYTENRMNEYDEAYENYAEHFNEYDKTLVYAGDPRELMMQFAGVLGCLHRQINQQTKGEARG